MSANGSHWSKLEVRRDYLSAPETLVYRLKWGLTDAPESQSFLEQVQADCRKVPRKVIVNMKEVEHLNSTGAGILTACFTTITNAGGKLALVGLSQRSQAILDVIRFLTLVRHFETEQGAHEYLRNY